MTPVPIVDAHIHLWDLDRFHYPWLGDPGAEEWQWNYLVEDFVKDSGGSEVTATVHVQAEMDHAEDPVLETAWLASLADANPAHAVPTVCVGYADLTSPDVEGVLDRHQEFDLFRGIRQELWFDPASTRSDIQRTNLLGNSRLASGLKQLAARDLSFDLLCWPAQLDQAAETLRDLPELSVVLEHVGLPSGSDSAQQSDWRNSLRRFADQVPRASLKISALSFVSNTWDRAQIDPLVQDALEIFGSERCMLGSNFPVDRPTVGYDQLWADLADMTSGLSDAERTRVFGGTAAEVYGIDLGVNA